MEELAFQTKGFFRQVKEFERMEGIFIGVSIPVGIVMIICALMSGIFFFTLEVIELGPIFGISMVSFVILLTFGGTYYMYGPIGRLMRKGERFQKKGKFDIALEYYNRALKLKPSSIMILFYKSGHALS